MLLADFFQTQLGSHLSELEGSKVEDLQRDFFFSGGSAVVSKHTKKMKGEKSVKVKVIQLEFR